MKEQDAQRQRITLEHISLFVSSRSDKIYFELNHLAKQQEYYSWLYDASDAKWALAQNTTINEDRDKVEIFADDFNRSVLQRVYKW